MIAHSHIDLVFPVHGRTLPRDHGYALYGALSRALPDLHQAGWLGVHGIAAASGMDPERLNLAKSGRLRLRIPVERLPQLIALAGRALAVSGHTIRLGPPSVHPLHAAASLDARLVVIRLTRGVDKPFDRARFDARFEAEARRQLERIGVAGELSLCGHRSVRVGGQRVMGHSVRVIGLSPEHSLALQIHGLGGKRAMGCGIFRPTRRVLAIEAAA